MWQRVFYFSSIGDKQNCSPPKKRYDITPDDNMSVDKK